jgi:hypothetical protein
VGAAGLPVRATDLDHQHIHRAQEAGQAGPVGAGALDPDPVERAEGAQPGIQLGEPSRRGRERRDAEHAAVRVERGSDVSVEVSVHPAGDLTCLYDGGHRHPFSVQRG